MIEWLINSALRFAGYGSVMLVLLMILAYFFQDRMLYIPNVPSRELKYPEWNPTGFRSPTEHMMDFEDVTVVTPDNLKLRGWFIKQPMPENTETITLIMFVLLLL